MLKRLELIGFKSFADKTVFDFPAGITAIVGPNGSGKSNIVDGVRWILGEQSAKSLRGGEMADVIFNGSSTRRPFGMAEVTMVFDNARRFLATDNDEVRISRRVYRTGEGEYLINGQVCRLKDIKDLFLGSGAGVDTMCIIAQGRVDEVLQSSTRDRRAIFEEAAGISRFKARKLETLRKLERVDQNLQRVKDIVEEVEKQLRSVKLQASKAVKYQEHSTRLRELRVALGVFDYRGLSQKIAEETQTLETLRSDLDQRAARAVACETEAERLEMLLADLEDQRRDQDAEAGLALSRATAAETQLNAESRQVDDAEKALFAARRQRRERDHRCTELARVCLQVDQEFAEAAEEGAARRQELTAAQECAASLAAETARFHESHAREKEDQLEFLRQAASLQNEASLRKAELEQRTLERERVRLRSTQAGETLERMDADMRQLEQTHADLSLAERSIRDELDGVLQELAELNQAEKTSDEQRSALRLERSALSSRIDVLESLIQGRDGLGAGVREVMSEVERQGDGEWDVVLGMVGDFLTVKRDYAPLIDLALGDAAERFLVKDLEKLVDVLRNRSSPLPGRVAFMPTPGARQAIDDPVIRELLSQKEVQLTLVSQLREDDAPAAPDHPGLVAPAEQLVSCEHPDLTNLPTALLGRTLIVRDLATALTISKATPGFRLITLDGEILDADGTLTLGAQRGDAGFLSRRSELRENVENRSALEAKLAEVEARCRDLRAVVDQRRQAAESLRARLEEQSRKGAEVRGRRDREKDRRAVLHQQMDVDRAEMDRLEQEIALLERAWTDASARAEEANRHAEGLIDRVRSADESIRVIEERRQAQQALVLDAQVALATCDERLKNLANRRQQATREREQFRADADAAGQTVIQLERRIEQSKLAVLRLSDALAHALLETDRLRAEIAKTTRARDQRRHDRARLAQQAQTVRNEWREHQETIHRGDLALSDFRHQLDSLVSRLRDDYQIDLIEAAQATARNATNTAGDNSETEPLIEGSAEATAIPFGEVSDLAPTDEGPAEAKEPETFEPENVRAEIEELRKRIAKLGSVNLEAVAELQELEQRAVSLRSQFDDLIEAKKSLEEIIGKINLDSRKMFLDTLGVVRGYFQELFRKLFGGGMADIVLEDEADVLECGIEINARPPGKELRSISLLSGGEKTLTAVALLLAVFRAKPSPFCLLDEVDAALDEANISRFTGVLREFLEFSQFIIVTHSKRTMACADVLYGITMQESGISKQVAVRFEDWVDVNGRTNTDRTGPTAKSSATLASEE